MITVSANVTILNTTDSDSDTECQSWLQLTQKYGTNMQGWKMRDLKMRHQTEGVENAKLENAGNDIVLNAAHCLCLLSFAGSKR